MPRFRRGTNISYMLVALASAVVTWSLSSWFMYSCGVSSFRSQFNSPFEDSFVALSRVPRSSRSLNLSSAVIQDKQRSSSIFKEWKFFDHPFPCYLGSKQLMITEPAHEGILFQRPTKVGSTTMVGIVLRLAHSRSPWLTKNLKCQHRAMHGSARSYEYGKRDRKRSFLFSLVRDPTQRAISEFFHFAVSSNDINPTDKNFKAYLRMPKIQNFYLNDLKTKDYTREYSKRQLEKMFYHIKGITSHEYDRVLEEGTMEESMLLEREWEDFQQHGPGVDHAQVVRGILSSYDFIAVTERMDESLVVMQILLNLSTRDILYTRARSSGSFSVAEKKPCSYIFPSFVSPGMEKYLESEEWKRTIRGDQLLYDAVNESLDRTIDAIGRDLFEKKLHEFRIILKKAQEHCQGRVKTLCSPGGERQDGETTCYIWGEGCDHECLSDFVF